MRREDADALIDDICGVVLTHLSGIGARCSRDPVVRRTIDAVVLQVRPELAEVCTKMADEGGEPPLDGRSITDFAIGSASGCASANFPSVFDVDYVPVVPCIGSDGVVMFVPLISHIAGVPLSFCHWMSDLPSPLKSPVPSTCQLGPGLEPTQLVRSRSCHSSARSPASRCRSATGCRTCRRR